MAESHRKRLLPTTHWSELVLAQDVDPDRRRAGMEQVLRRYYPALLAYLRAVRGFPADVCEDLVQGFVADKIVQGQLLEQVDRDQGRFRSYLLRVFNNYVANVFRSERTQRRGGGAPKADVAIAEPSAPAARDHFELAWAQELLKETLQRMERDCKAAGRRHIWEIFQARVVQPELQNVEPIDYATLVEQFKFDSPSQAFNALATAKRMFERLLRQVLAEYAPNGDPEDELRSLRAVCSAMRA